MSPVLATRALLRAAAACIALTWGAPALAAAGAAADSVVGATSATRSIAQILAQADSALRVRGGSHAENAQLFLSWDAPWGSRRARRERTPACADSSRGDTLYLCFQPGLNADRFTGFTARLFVRATGEDTLGNWWHMQGKGGANAGALRVEWAALQDWGGTRQPFRTQGQGMVQLLPERALARLDMVYAVSLPEAGPVRADSIYALARIILRHQPGRPVSGCERPVVVEWAYSGLAFGPKDEPRVSRGERFVTFGGPYSLTEPFRGVKAPVWKPPAPTAR